jgi:hypothetical protein
MKGSVDFDLKDIIPSREDVLLNQGMPPGAEVPDRIGDLLTVALKEFESSAAPVGLIREISVEEFAPIFAGEGENAEDVLLARIYPEGDNLALFAVTMGQEVSSSIEKLFEEKEFTAGSMLDATASIAADTASEIMERLFMEDLSERGLITGDHFVLGYSPGYCGWHITAQRKLFDYLDPGQIGITLNESCLMIPLKSITGLLVSGRGSIHIFEQDFEYCRSCMNRSCLDRMSRISSHKPSTA